MDGTHARSKRGPRVGVVSYHSNPIHEPGSGDAGGMSVCIKALSAALALRGVATDIFTRASAEGDRQTEIAPGVRVIPIEAGPRAHVPKEDLLGYVDDFAVGVRSHATVQRISYDILHSHYWQSGLAAKKLVEAWRIPLVHSHHTLARVKNAALAPGELPEPDVRLRGEDDVIRAADVLIASTDAEYQDLACMYRAPHDRLKVLPPGVDHALFRPLVKAEARKRLGLEERPTLLVVGRIQPLKGIELALRAVEHLVHALEVPPTLVVVGGASGPRGEVELSRLRDLARSLQISQHVRFVGAQPHHSLPFYYAATDVTVVCSHSESFGLTALESHACGRPVVGTPVGGLSHIVQNATTGFLIDDRDPHSFAARLKVLLADDTMRASFGAAAAAAAARFSWENAAAAYDELYECLIRDVAPELCTC